MARPSTFVLSCWIILICLVEAASVLSQNNDTYTHYTTRDGLPSNLIYELDQDSAGFIWISTDNGISRFDGKRFQNYGYTEGLVNLDVLGLEFDNFGRKWLATIYPNLCYLENHRLHCLPDSVFKMLGSSHPMIYNSTDTTLVFFDREYAIVLNAKTLKILDSSKNDSTMIKLLPVHDRIKYNSEYKDGTVKYSNTLNNLQLVNHKTGAQSQVFKQHQHILDKGLIIKKNLIHQDRFLVLQTRAGCYFIDLESPGQPYHIYLEGHHVHRCFFDNNSNLWIPTKKSGLFKFTPQQQPHLLLGKKNKTANEINAISGMIVAGDKILVTHGSQVSVFNSNLNKVHANNILMNFSEGVVKIKREESILHILSGQSIYRYDFIENVSKCVIENFKNITKPHFNFKEFHIIDDDQYLLCFNQILYLEDSSTHIVHIPESPRVTSILSASDSILFIGTQRGVFKYNPIKKNAIELLSQIPKNYTAWLGTDQDQNLIAIFRNGMIKTYIKSAGDWLDKSTYQSENFVFNDAVLYDDRLAVASTEGLLVFNSSTLELISQYHLIDLGLQTSISYVDRINDNYVLASEDQIVLFHDSISSSSPGVITQIENIQINGGNKDYSLPNELSYNERDITINFSTPYYQNLTLTHEYQLLSHDHAPIRSTDTKVTYSNLVPGKYQFRIRPIIGGFNETEFSNFNFQISKPWWNTHLFYILFALSLIGIAYYFYNQSKLKEKAKSNLLQYRLNAIHAQMNPHFLFNGLQSVQYYIATKDSKKATSYLGSFATLVRKTLESSAHDHIIIEDEIEYLESYLALKKEELDDNLHFDINMINEELRSSHIPSMVLQPFLENAFVHGFTDKNEEHKLNITFESSNSTSIMCTISDNGTGLNHDKKRTTGHRSFASKAIERKLKMLDQLYFKNNVMNNITILDNRKIDDALFTKGCTIKIVLPILQSTKK